jgi:hypothetical protein
MLMANRATTSRALPASAEKNVLSKFALIIVSPSKRISNILYDQLVIGSPAILRRKCVSSTPLHDPVVMEKYHLPARLL